MPKSSLSNMSTPRLKEPFDPALDAPIALTPDQLEQVVGGFFSIGPWLGGVTLELTRPYRVAPMATTGFVSPQF